MKDEFVAVVIMLAFIVLFSYNSYAVETKTKRITELIDEVDLKGEADHANIRKIRTVWKKEKKILSFMIAHKIISDVDECIEMAEECIEVGKQDEAMHLLKKARHHLKDLKEREKIKLDNIF